MLAAALLVVLLLQWLGPWRARRGYRLRAPQVCGRRNARKPAWVRKELIRLKALMDRASCRTLADIFNRRFAASRCMTVGKTFVSDVIRRHRYEIAAMRRQIRRAKPKSVPRNHIWAMDLTGKTTLDGRTRLVLGILEHASRGALVLEALRGKSSWTLIERLVSAIRRYGKPRAVRTDNEAVFTSRVFRLSMFILGIRHQRTDPGCPWQNGRVERFFGTLKQKLDSLAVDSLDALNSALTEFRFFYNHVRPHQNLDGRTPAEAWTGIDPYTAKFKKEYWFETWDGLLTGYYLRR